MNNDNDINYHLHDQISGWLRYCRYTVGTKSRSLVDIGLVFVILYNIIAPHHNKNLFPIEIKLFKQVVS